MKCGILKTGNGMTLVEVLVASIIGVVLAGIIVIMYLLFDNQVREDSAYTTMQMQYENFSEQVAFNARRAHRILESSVAYYDTCDIWGDTVKSVTFYDVGGIPFAGVGIFGDTIKEVDAATGNWKPFKTGNGILTADTSSVFLLGGCKSSIGLNISLKMNDRDSVFVMEPRKDEFLCRNRN